MAPNNNKATAISATATAAVPNTAAPPTRMMTRSQKAPTTIDDLRFTDGAKARALRFVGQATAHKLSYHQHYFPGSKPLNPQLKELEKLAHYPHPSFEGKGYDWQRAKRSENELERQRSQGQYRRQQPKRAVAEGIQYLDDDESPSTDEDYLQGKDVLLLDEIEKATYSEYIVVQTPRGPKTILKTTENAKWTHFVFQEERCPYGTASLPPNWTTNDGRYLDFADGKGPLT